MAEAEFTAGPWSYAPAVPGAKRRFYISGNHAAHNREVDIGTVQGGYYSCEANAALIAAAPDLYEALTDLEGWVGRVLEPTFSARKPMPENLAIALEKARAALAKAAPPHRKNTED